MARLRSVLPVLAGAYAVHALRYALAFGHDAPTVAGRQGHAYLLGAPYLLTVLLAIAVSRLALRTARHGPAAPVAGRRSLLRAWAILAAGLLAIFVVQESVEGWLAPGHPAGLAAVLGHGGWLAVPLCAAVGLAVAVLQRGAQALLSARIGRVSVPRPRPLATLRPCAASGAHAWRAEGPWLRGRAPPAWRRPNP